MPESSIQPLHEQPTLLGVFREPDVQGPEPVLHGTHQDPVARGLEIEGRRLHDEVEPPFETRAPPSRATVDLMKSSGILKSSIDGDSLDGVIRPEQ
jgi:hypothetical protein